MPMIPAFGGFGVQSHPLLQSELLVSLPGKTERSLGIPRWAEDTMPAGDQVGTSAGDINTVVFQEVAPVFPKPEPALRLPKPSCVGSLVLN